ncbi:MAG: histidine phosphatase family protein [Candidatus Moraniibacteriota bacterium]
MVDQYSHNSYFLVRHGEAENNVRNILDAVTGKPEYPLTARGRGQAAQTGEYLADQNIDFIVASPILRAKETAEIIQKTLDVPLSFDVRLTEAKVGDFEGKTLDLFLDFMKEHGGRLAGLPEEGIEGYADIRERIRGFLQVTSESFTGKNIVIVSHGDPLQEMYGELMGMGSERAEGSGGWYPEKGSCMLVARDKTEEYVPKS